MFVAQRIVAKKLLPLTRMSFASKDHFYQIMPNLDETRTDLLQMVEGFADAEVKPLADEMDKSMKFPHHMWKVLGD
jgi:alkylation response protein AidB-like acyl-CoA dehydrogenase